MTKYKNAKAVIRLVKQSQLEKDLEAIQELRDDFAQTLSRANCYFNKLQQDYHALTGHYWMRTERGYRNGKQT